MIKSKNCDRCKVRHTKNNPIYRLSVQLHTPYYNYLGFDLCGTCLIKFENKVKNFLKLK